jgi:hypothetical protein
MSTQTPRDTGWRMARALRLLAITAAFAFICAMPASLSCLARWLGF